MIQMVRLYKYKKEVSGKKKLSHEQALLILYFMSKFKETFFRI